MSTPTRSILADDVEVLRRILTHIDARTTDEGESWREPVENYLSPTRFADEVRLMRAMPSVYMPAAAIPDSGDYAERVTFGVSLFAVRGRDGKARVFRNACRHRGVALVEGSGCSHALVCGYHGWTYRLDGSLAHVPHSEGFPGLDLPFRGLTEVESYEVDGLIIIGPLDPPTNEIQQARVDAALTTLTDGRPWRHILQRCKRAEILDSTLRPFNWKVAVEQFLEGYHIRTTHKETFYPLQYDNLTVVETFGPNSRIAFPYRAIERLRDMPESRWTIDGRLTYVYQLFPNVMIGTFAEQVFIFVAEPIDIDHTLVTTYSLPTPEVAEQAAVKIGPADTNELGIRALLGQGSLEDNEMSTAVQRGFHAGANSFVEFGRHESAGGHFHGTLTRRLTELAE